MPPQINNKVISRSIGLTGIFLTTLPLIPNKAYSNPEELIWKENKGSIINNKVNFEKINKEKLNSKYSEPKNYSQTSKTDLNDLNKKINPYEAKENHIKPISKTHSDAAPPPPESPYSWS